MQAETVSILQAVPDAPIIARRVLTTPDLAAQQTPELLRQLWNVLHLERALKMAEAHHA